MNKWTFLTAVVIIALIALSNNFSDQHSEDSDSAGVQVADVLGRNAGDGESDGYALALEPISFSFPKDHGPHRSFRNEWWYFTGNLWDNQQRRYGFHLTFFRQGINAKEQTHNGWKDSDIYLAHFAISDISNAQFYHQEKLARSGAGVIQIQDQPLSIKFDDWQLISSGEDFFPVVIMANDRGQALKLTLNTSKPLVLQGNQGLSQKNEIPGNASYYYSFSRLEAQGQLTLGDKTLPVQGTTWMDREWSSSALSEDQVGWDWFSLQFENGYDLMFYQLRNKDGSASSYSSGALIDPQGNKTPIKQADMKIQPIKYWQAPQGQRYPVAWSYNIKLPEFSQSGIISAAQENQLMDTSIKYWEGAVDVRDEQSQSVGYGFLEMTGY